VIFICHGYADSSIWFWHRRCARLCSEGKYKVISLDLEGHGHSDGLGVYIPVFDDLCQGAYEVFTSFSSSAPFSFLMGESMGGAVALFLLLKFKINVTGTILVAPMCKIMDKFKPPKFVVFILTMWGKLFPTLPIVPSPDLIPFVWENKAILAEMEANPLRHRLKPRIATAISLLDASNYCEDNLDKVNTPILITHGEADKVTDPLISQALFEKSTSQDKTLKMYPGIWHGLFEEAPTFYEDVFLWIKARSTVSSTTLGLL